MDKGGFTAYIEMWFPNKNSRPVIGRKLGLGLINHWLTEIINLNYTVYSYYLKLARAVIYYVSRQAVKAP